MASNMLPAYLVFDTDNDISLLPQKWEEWVGGLEDLTLAFVRFCLPAGARRILLPPPRLPAEAKLVPNSPSSPSLHVLLLFLLLLDVFAPRYNALSDC